MKTVFADTVYWSALLNRQDNLHLAAIKLSESISNLQIVTSELVFVELQNGVSSKGTHLRAMATAMVESLRYDRVTIVEPLTPEAFEAALDFYGKRADKAWSLTDCSSFLIMQRYRIGSTLTYDRHFEQAGSTALLR